MWHETREEMMEFLKSIFRLDQDQCAHRLVRTTLGFRHDNYYEIESECVLIKFEKKICTTHLQRMCSSTTLS